MIEFLGQVWINEWPAIVGLVFCVSALVWLRARRRELKPMPRPNRVPYDKDKYRRK